LILLSGPISYGQAVILGLLQGVAELFPISSLGQSVIAPRVFGWDIHQNDNYFIAFLVATHLATAIVLLFFFGRDWARILSGMWRSLQEREISPTNPDGRLGWLIVVATIPAGILGLLLQDKLQSVFASARSAAFFLILNGILLYFAEQLRKRAPGVPEGEQDGDHRIAERTSWRQSVAVGAAQAIALIPGFSRSGASMSGGLRVGLSNEDAARFAFLLATPVILAAGVLKVPDLAGHLGAGIRGQILFGSVLSGVGAYLSVRFLLRYLRTRTLTPFGVYCLIVGLASIAFLTVAR
jgi:undecaprenyl-diphosphatase